MKFSTQVFLVHPSHAYTQHDVMAMLEPCEAHYQVSPLPLVPSNAILIKTGHLATIHIRQRIQQA
jgi:hypothetical protein